MREEIRARVRALREKMKEAKVDAYLVPTNDFHDSEYVGEYFKCRKYLTGFTGSAGTAVVTAHEAGLWTDGRYFLQAAQQLEGTDIRLFPMGEPGVPTVEEYLQDKLTEGQCLGYDGRTVGAAQAEELEALLGAKGVTQVKHLDLVGDLWEDRPSLSCRPVWELDTCWCGESRAEKLARVRARMEEKKADLFLLSSLDDIAWLLNLRGDDIQCNPVFLSYLLMDQKEVMLFAGEEAFSDELKGRLLTDGVRLLPYHDIYAHLGELSPSYGILLQKERVNSLLLEALPQGIQVLDEENPTLLMKAVKNPTEVENMRRAHVKDGLAVTRFAHWIKEVAGKDGLTELSAEKQLFAYRKAQENFLGDSFEPILSYGPHAAIVHYSATPETDVPIEKRGLLLVDSGGQYLEGTTDITRTFAVGPLTQEEKIYFTEVLRGHLALSDAIFRQGCTGMNLDYLARSPLWRLGKDYNHGTGHGIGYLLNVHEGPNAIRWRKLPSRGSNAVLEEGMITSNEPGYYEAGRFGIRHESLVLCKKMNETEAGTFLGFETLTLVPFDRDGILPERLTSREKEVLNAYHQRVFDVLSPYMTQEETVWLREMTQPI